MYSARIKDEVIMLFKALRFSPHCVQVQALFACFGCCSTIAPASVAASQLHHFSCCSLPDVSTSATAPQSHQLAMMHTVVQSIVSMKAAHH